MYTCSTISAPICEIGACSLAVYENLLWGEAANSATLKPRRSPPQICDGRANQPKLSPMPYGHRHPSKWSGRRDLNPRPHGPKPCALSKLSYYPMILHRLRNPDHSADAAVSLFQVVDDSISDLIEPFRFYESDDLDLSACFFYFCHAGIIADR